VLITGYALLRQGWPVVALGSDAQLPEVVLALLILTAAVFAVRARSTLGAVVMLGVVGYGIALVFAIHGAPDLAMTQFVIEALIVVLFVLVVHRLPMLHVRPTSAVRLRNLSVAISGGLLMTLLVLTASNVPVPEPISTYFGERSVPDAHGRNVVNVILVDFRALDTLGEIVVLALAGIGVYALIRLRLSPRREP